MTEEIYDKTIGRATRNPDIEPYIRVMEFVFQTSLERLRDFVIKSPESLNGDKRHHINTERFARSSWRWLEAEDFENPFSFVNICESFGYNYEKIREMTYDMLRENRTLDYFLNGKNRKERVA